MLKRLNTIQNAVSLSKKEQSSLNGGNYFPAQDCAVVCSGAPYGRNCLVDGHIYCPAFCDGQGGFLFW